MSLVKQISYKVATNGVTTFYIDGEKFHSKSIHNPDDICNLLNDARQKLTDYEIGYLSQLLEDL
jgi:hypothetical protein